MSRDLRAPVLWAASAVAWVAAAHVPWFRAGLLAEVSLMEVAALLRAGVLEDVAPVTAYAVVALPLLAVLLLALAPVRGRAVGVLRALLWVTVSGLGLAAVIVLAGYAGGALGWGAGLVVAAAALGGAALVAGLTGGAADTARRTGWASRRAAG